MSYVNFGRNNTRAEALTSTNKDKIFFPTDDTSIILGGKEYGANKETINKINSITDAPNIVYVSSYKSDIYDDLEIVNIINS